MRGALTRVLLTALATCAARRCGRGPVQRHRDRHTASGEQGRRLFAKVWTAAEGLGPLANAQSCAACRGDPSGVPGFHGWV